jgi:hypothetical protein
MRLLHLLSLCQEEEETRRRRKRKRRRFERKREAPIFGSLVKRNISSVLFNYFKTR